MSGYILSGLDMAAKQKIQMSFLDRKTAVSDFFYFIFYGYFKEYHQRWRCSTTTQLGTHKTTAENPYRTHGSM